MFRPPGFGRLVWQTATIFLASLLAVGPASAYKPPPRPPALNILLERANNGNVTAQNLLGMQYLRGENGANRDHTEARKWLSLAAQNEGNDAVQAKWVLGTMLYYGIGGPMEKQKGLELQQKVVAQNRLHLALGEQYYQVGKFSDAATILTHGIKPDDWLPNVAVAHRLLGLMHLRGDGVVRSDVQAFSHFCRAAFGEDGISMIFLAGLYAEGKGVERNPDFSKLLVREAAKRGVDFSKTAFKNSFPSLEGDGEVVRQLAKLAESGDAGASYSLGLAFRSGRGVAASSELAIKYLENSAHHDNADAQFHLAETLASIPRDFRDRSQEYRLLLFAAQRGHAYATYRLAEHIDENALIAAHALDYAMGFHFGGVEELVRHTRDHASESYGWFTKAGQMGIAASYSRIVNRYAAGCAGCPRYAPIDRNLEIKYTQLAAKNGHVPSMVSLGFQYGYTFDGKSGVSKNIGEARRWFNSAAKQQAVFAYSSVLEARRQLKLHAYGGDEVSDKKRILEICAQAISP